MVEVELKWRLKGSEVDVELRLTSRCSLDQCQARSIATAKKYESNLFFSTAWVFEDCYYPY